MKNSVVILIANGSNEIEIPCRIFPDMETAKKECNKIFEMTSDENNSYDICLEELEIKQQRRISNKLFGQGNWYYGCGGPGSFELQEVAFNKKLVGWNLD